MIQTPNVYIEVTWKRFLVDIEINLETIAPLFCIFKQTHIRIAGSPGLWNIIQDIHLRFLSISIRLLHLKAV